MDPLGLRQSVLPAVHHISRVNKALFQQAVNDHLTCNASGSISGKDLKWDEPDQKPKGEPGLMKCASPNEESWKEIVARLGQPGFKVDDSTNVSLLRRCGTVKCLLDGKRVHQHIIREGREGNMFLGNLLVQMYGKCGALDDAHDLFAKIHWRGQFSWNCMISSYTRQGQGKEALQLFNQMQQEGIMADNFLLTSIIAASACKGSLTQGKQIHARVAECGFESDVAVLSALVNMYAKCDSLQDARIIFDKMPERNTFSWTTMVAAYAQQEHGKDALQLFQQMLEEGILPNEVTFVSILSACGSHAAVTQCQWMHACIIGSGFELDAPIRNAILNMYAKCCSMDDAQRMFDNLPKHDVISWNSMITAYFQHGQSKEALQCFGKMLKQGVMPNNVTFISTLSLFVSDADLDQGKQMHVLAVCSRFEAYVDVGNALVNMYGKCGSLDDAQRMFDKMANHDVVSWNAMIAAYVQHGQGTKALNLFKQMRQREGISPDRVTFISLLSACSGKGALSEGRLLHADIIKHGYDTNVVVGSALVNMYGKCGSVDSARLIFEKLRERGTGLWTALMAVYAQRGHAKEALRLFQQMQQAGIVPNNVTFVTILSACVSKDNLIEGKQIHVLIVDIRLESDVIVATALLSMYGKCGSLEDAQAVFDKMQQQSTVSWNALIDAYVGHCDGKEALQLFQKMLQQGVMPDMLTFISILSACVSHFAIAEGKQMHICILEREFKSESLVENALLSMYGKCGSLDDAQRMFDQMSTQDVISWTSIITAYAQHGQGKVALIYYNQMNEEVKPDEVTFISILSACSRAGLVEEGRHFFKSMSQDHGIKTSVDHYNCMLDLLGRAGLLEEAEGLIRKMPFQPNVVSWMTLLAACKTQVDVQRGECAASHLLELEPQNASPYLMLSNIYTEVGKQIVEQSS